MGVFVSSVFAIRISVDSESICDNIPSYPVLSCIGAAALYVASVERHYLFIRNMQSNDKDDTLQIQFQRS